MTDYLELIWLVTSIWVGYDFDCYEVNSLKEGIKESVLISKNDLTKLLSFAVCVLDFMHTFIWYIFESIQIQKERDIFKYYKDVIDSEKPYGQEDARESVCIQAKVRQRQKTLC